MITTPAATAALFFTAASPRGASPVAQFIADRAGEVRRQFQESISFGARARVAMEELCDTFEHCKAAGWDGYDAFPVDPQTYYNASRFIEALPAGIAAPSIGVEPDGHLTFEWYKQPRQTLSVSISPDGEIHYAGLFGGSKAYGTEPFYGEIPSALLELIQRLQSS